MATATATKKERKTTKKNTVKNTLADLNLSLINSSEDLIENTIITGEKYQKLFAKTLKKTEPLVEKQVDIMFDTIESLKGQFDFGTVRFKKLIGWNGKALKKFRKNATKNINDLRKNAEDKIDALQDEFHLGGKSIPTPAKTKKTLTRKVKTAVKKTSVLKASDLKVVDGIGPKMEKVLHVGGIKTIKALAKSSATRIEKIVEKSGSNFKAMNPESWITQARKIAK